MAADRLTLHDVLAGTGGQLRGSGGENLPLSGISLDSRRVARGALFVALRGQKHDGHAFVAEAFANGASAALVERVPGGEVWAEGDEGPPLVLVPSTPDGLRSLAHYWLGHHPVEIVAVVGSIGRATTVELTAAVLRQRFGVLAASAAERPDLRVPLALLQLGQGISRVVLDLSLSQPAEVGQLVELARPSVVAVTNVESKYTEHPASLEELAQVKRALVEALPTEGTAVLNADDERVRAMAPANGAARVFYGLGSSADVQARGIVGHGLQGMELELLVGRQSIHVRLPLLGLNSVHSALAASGVGVASGLELIDIGAGLQTASPTPRIIAATGLNGSRSIDDSYNASPESSLEALNLLEGLNGRKIAVLGDMLDLGRSELLGHQKVGNRAAMVANELVTVGERARWIADEARRVGLNAASTFEAGTNEEAIDYLRRRLRPGDNVLVKGSSKIAMDAIVRAIRLEG
jgi:UDP-N-acetylmuramoyl-tripeptide--D-alanyl-D-alanine ligase